jgi:hypothetical protein
MGTWVAEHAVALLGKQPASRRAARVVSAARRAAVRGWPISRQQRCVRIGVHAARLAQLDAVYRAGYPPTFGEVDGVTESAIAHEVSRLLEIGQPIWDLARQKPLLLNPNFGFMSTAVGGADADILAGDTLIEIKTTREACIERDFMRQLVGYAALAIASRRETGLPTVRNVAIYFSRFGVLHKAPLPTHIAPREYATIAFQLAEAWLGLGFGFGRKTIQISMPRLTEEAMG